MSFTDCRVICASNSCRPFQYDNPATATLNMAMPSGSAMRSCPSQRTVWTHDAILGAA